MENRQGDVLGQGTQRFSQDSNLKTTDLFHQGYELSEEEVRISLDEFRNNFSDVNGGPK